MAFDEQLGRCVGQKFKTINVLSTVLQQESLVCQQCNKGMRQRWKVACPRPHFTSQRTKGLWIFATKVKSKHGLWIGQIMLLQIVVQPSSRAAKV